VPVCLCLCLCVLWRLPELQDISALHNDLAIEILQHVTPEALLSFELRHNLPAYGIDTTALWVKILDRAQLSIVSSDVDTVQLSPLDVRTP
jgi:hypothetical protein